MMPFALPSTCGGCGASFRTLAASPVSARRAPRLPCRRETGSEFPPAASRRAKVQAAPCAGLCPVARAITRMRGAAAWPSV